MSGSRRRIRRRWRHSRGGQPNLGEYTIRSWPYVAGSTAVTVVLLGAYMVVDTGSSTPGASAAERPDAAAPPPAASPGASGDGVTPQMRALGITRRISAFSTRYKAGEPRVRNIRLGAAALNGQVVRPGATFSFNRVVGPRTRRRGYVPAPTIVGARLVNDVGGGICQVSATLFNAVFESGLRIKKARAHSLWMPEYPKGREAAVYYPGLDFVWRNDSGRPVMIQAMTTPTSLTITLWGTRRFGVRSKESKPYARKPYSSAVDHGARCVPMRGGQGFQINVWRFLQSDGRPIRRERFHTTYQPQTRVRCAK
ncbi:VanW family protein [Actinomadura barringtoniae]|uniref:VanW family protein n=1 Tax=Actinomadura barringtoniae TaxID=1427535 RepID=A0A939PCU2_9ACTN|nr:VanW family protein [Actinomadura barringtoniae]MBO2447314.1 VanW family protein [Actinomadura barringtoniae]